MSDWLDFLGDQPQASSEWSGIAVAGFSPRLIGKGRELATQLGCTLTVLVSEAAKAKNAIALGADKVVVGNAAAAVDSEKPEIVLGEEDNLFPLAHTLRAGCTRAGGVDLDVSTRTLIVRVPAYGGKMTIEYASESRPQFAVLRPDGLPEPASDPARTGDVVEL